jgi:uncharacterized protein YjiS (DUF1127 family)
MPEVKTIHFSNVAEGCIPIKYSNAKRKTHHQFEYPTKGKPMTTCDCNVNATPARAARRPWALRLISRITAAQALHRQHQALLRLDDAMLRDIGITQSEAQALARNSIWDVPNHWKA